MEYFVLLYRVFLIVFYIFTLWYDVNFIGMRFNPEANEMNFFMEGRLYLLTGKLNFEILLLNPF